MIEPQIDEMKQAHHLLLEGKIIAYPTEAVYGLGCDPFNQKAVEKLLQIKQRVAQKGLIVLIADWEQLEDLTQAVSSELLVDVKASWPGPVTWIFPKATSVPHWLSGDHKTIAIRMTAHPVARALAKFGPVVSTSANVSGQEPARDLEQLFMQFPRGIDGVLRGAIGDSAQPSRIYNVLTKERLR